MDSHWVDRINSHQLGSRDRESFSPKRISTLFIIRSKESRTCVNSLSLYVKELNENKIFIKYFNFIIIYIYIYISFLFCIYSIVIVNKIN